ncbi:MAG: response regulator [Candidatus Kapaibacteriales bacterium]
MAEKTISKRGNLLIVDDDTNWLKLISTLLSNHFNVATAKSGPEGLDILRSGFNPGVILSDLNMPIMNGIEFLKEAGKIHPLALKIIISAYANPQEIIAVLNQSRAYMYLMKPVDTIQLIQILKNAFDTYNLILKNNQLVETLKKMGITDPQTISKLKSPAELQKSDVIVKEFITALRKLFAQSEKYYFTNHLAYVIAISEALAKALKFTDKTITEILISASLINIPYLLMPKRFNLYDPYDLDQDEKVLFFSSFSEAISILSKIEAIKVEVDILSQIWENQAGTGGPNGLQGNEVLQEAQVISIANIYHNKVYRLQPQQLSQLEVDGVVIQPRE